jgi:hypothetical protein
LLPPKIHDPERGSAVPDFSVKPQEVTAAYDHYSILRTIEDNFGLGPIHKDSGDGAASIITSIWK